MGYDNYAGFGDISDDGDFADPGGRSALRASSRSNPRNLPCPTCQRKNVLTPADRRKGYQCDRCADRDEGRFGGSDDPGPWGDVDDFYGR